MTKDYKDLRVWQNAKELCVSLIHLIKEKPAKVFIYDELYKQVVKSAISVVSNIAEGYTRTSKLEKKRFLDISAASASELETQLIIINQANLLETENLTSDLIIVKKMLTKLRQYYK